MAPSSAPVVSGEVEVGAGVEVGAVVSGAGEVGDGEGGEGTVGEGGPGEVVGGEVRDGGGIGCCVRAGVEAPGGVPVEVGWGVVVAAGDVGRAVDPVTAVLGAVAVGAGTSGRAGSAGSAVGWSARRPSSLGKAGMGVVDPRSEDGRSDDLPVAVRGAVAGAVDVGDVGVVAGGSRVPVMAGLGGAGDHRPVTEPGSVAGDVAGRGTEATGGGAPGGVRGGPEPGDGGTGTGGGCGRVATSGEEPDLGGGGMKPGTPGDTDTDTGTGRRSVGTGIRRVAWVRPGGADPLEAP